MLVLKAYCGDDLVCEHEFDNLRDALEIGYLMVRGDDNDYRFLLHKAHTTRGCWVGRNTDLDTNTLDQLVERCGLCLEEMS